MASAAANAYLIDEIIRYLGGAPKQQAESKTQDSGLKIRGADAAQGDFQAASAIVRKEAECYGGDTSKQKKRKGKKGRKNKSQSKPMLHGADVLHRFQTVGVVAPFFATEIPACIALLEERKALFLSGKAASSSNGANGVKANDAEDLAADNAERESRGKEAAAAMDAEQERRSAEAAQEKASESQREKDERAAAGASAKKAALDEQARRVAEQEAVVALTGLAEKREAEQRKQLVQSAVEKERMERVSANAAASMENAKEEAQERSKRRRASIQMMDGERARRIAEQFSADQEEESSDNFERRNEEEVAERARQQLSYTSRRKERVPSIVAKMGFPHGIPDGEISV